MSSFDSKLSVPKTLQMKGGFTFLHNAEFNHTTKPAEMGFTRGNIYIFHMENLGTRGLLSVSQI